MRGQKYIFTEEQKKYIIDNWGKESIHSMKNRFNCSWYAIAAVGKDNNLELPKFNEWTEEDVNKLIEYAKEYDVKTIAELMNRTEQAIFIKANRLNITLYKNKRAWTSEEERIFSELWGQISIEVIAKKLSRSIYSLKVKAIRMGLGSVISNNTDVLTVSDITNVLGVTRDKVISWSKKGLKLKTKKISNNKKFYYVEWNDLINFLKNNQDLWDASKVDYYMLGEEYDWLIKKRKEDFINKPLSYRVWSNKEKVAAVNYFKLGYSYEEIAKLINRSAGETAKLLRKEGYYLRDRLWTEEEVMFLRENYKSMTQDEIANVLHKRKKQIEYKLHKEGLKKVRTLKK